VHLRETAPEAIDDATLKTWLAAKLDGSHPEFDAPDDNTMYVVFLPQGTTYTLGPWTGCKEFGASDNMLNLPNGKPVAYIGVPRCPATPGLDAWNSLSAVISHEIYEEATDPFKTAWITVDDAHMGWSLAPPLSEIGDMCIADPSTYVVPADVGSSVQRAWSNAAAAAGKNPCVPAPAGATYFNAAPVFEEDVPIGLAADAGGWSGVTRGVRLPVGESKTIEVDLFSEGPMPPWRVRAFDFARLEGRPEELSLALDVESGQNGDKLHLTITAMRAGSDGGSRFVLFSDDGQNDAFWIGYVAN
jgi:hypothetical protein